MRPVLQHKVMVTAGANQAFVNLVLALLDPQDSVVLFAPYYFNHMMAIQVRSQEAVQIQVPIHSGLNKNKDLKERSQLYQFAPLRCEKTGCHLQQKFSPQSLLLYKDALGSILTLLVFDSR